MNKEEADKLPYIAISNNDLANMQDASDNEFGTCPNCKEQHPLKYGTVNGKESKMIGFVDCTNGSTYMATFMGKIFKKGLK
jgi:hypothetical protein